MPIANSTPIPSTAERPSVAVVPAAGFGTRLRPLTQGALPKEMLPVGRRLALEHIVEELRAAGMSHVVFVISPAKEALLRRHFGDGDGTNVTFAYVLQAEMRGLGDAILQAAALLEKGAPFVVALGDAVFEEPTPGGLTRRLADMFAARKAAVGLAVQHVARERISRYGVVKPASPVLGAADAFPITDIVEKPAPDDAPSEFAAAARYVVAGDVFEYLRKTPPGKGGEVQLTDALRAMLQEGRPGVAVPLQPGEVRHDIGGLDSYFRAFAAFALRDPEHGEALEGWLRTRLDVSSMQEENAAR